MNTTSKKPFYGKEISDLFITIPIAFLGFGVLATFFYLSIFTYNETLLKTLYMFIEIPLLGMAVLIFIKALVLDFIRINKKIRLTMPGHIYWISSLQWISLWMTYDILFNSASAKMSDSKLRSIFLYEYSLLFWLVIDLIVSVIVFQTLGKIKITDQSPEVEITKNFELMLFKQQIASLLTFILATFVSILLV